MSLVGPRPLILEEAKHAAQTWHARRLDLRPGITGLWQVSGRSDLPFQEMVRFDYQYVSGWSLARDVEILLATIPVVLSRPRRLLDGLGVAGGSSPETVAQLDRAGFIRLNLSFRGRTPTRPHEAQPSSHRTGRRGR